MCKSELLYFDINFQALLCDLFSNLSMLFLFINYHTYVCSLLFFRFAEYTCMFFIVVSVLSIHMYVFYCSTCFQHTCMFFIFIRPQKLQKFGHILVSRRRLRRRSRRQRHPKTDCFQIITFERNQ